MTRLVFIDTETTSLRPDRRAWEVGLIVRRPGGPDEPHHWFVAADDLDLGNADPMALKVGRFYDRHPAYAQSYDPAASMHASERVVLQDVERATRGAHLVGAVVNFDADVLGTRMRAHGIAPSWHYHLIDVEALAVGFLNGRADVLATHILRGDGDPYADLPGLPWKSDGLSARLGITVSDEDRHTALGDARWAMRIYDAVTGRPS